MIKLVYKRFISERQRNNIIFFLSRLVAPYYFGNRFFCNCCNRKFRKFLPKGTIKRKNAKCPYCGSLERTRLLYLYLLNETVIFKNHLKVLHIAPEKCLFDNLKKLDIEYIDGDINPACATYVIDITDINYPDNYFDLIICSHVLGHVPNEPKAIKELHRVLKSDGEALIMTLLNTVCEETYEDYQIDSSASRLKSYGEPDLFRLHGLDFSKRLADGNFIVEKLDYRNEYSKEIIEHCRLGDGQREIIFRCKKN